MKAVTEKLLGREICIERRKLTHRVSLIRKGNLVGQNLVEKIYFVYKMKEHQWTVAKVEGSSIFTYDISIDDVNEGELVIAVNEHKELQSFEKSAIVNRLQRKSRTDISAQKASLVLRLQNISNQILAVEALEDLDDYSRNSRVPNFECDPPSIVDVIDSFFDEEFFNLVVSQTNLYHTQMKDLHKNSAKTLQWKEVTRNDMKKFLGLLVLMGQTKKTCWRDYWSTDPLVEIPIFPKTMSRMRFEQIFTFFHLSDNVENVLSTDRLYKITPLLDYVISKSQSMYVPKQQLSLNEAMIPWRGRLKFKTYNPAKLQNTEFYVILWPLFTARIFTMLGLPMFTVPPVISPIPDEESVPVLSIPEPVTQVLKHQKTMVVLCINTSGFTVSTGEISYSHDRISRKLLRKVLSKLDQSEDGFTLCQSIKGLAYTHQIISSLAQTVRFTMDRVQYLALADWMMKDGNWRVRRLAFSPTVNPEETFVVVPTKQSWGSFTYQDVETNCTVHPLNGFPMEICMGREFKVELDSMENFLRGQCYMTILKNPDAWDIKIGTFDMATFMFRQPLWKDKIVFLAERLNVETEVCRQMRMHKVQGKDILSTVGFKIPPKTLTSHYVPIVLVYKFILSEFPDTTRLFQKQFQEGIAHKHRMRKFLSHEKKAPLLLCVEKSDDKCVSVPLWIDQFIKDLERFRQEVRKNPTTCTSGEFVKRAASASNTQYFKERKLDNEPEPGPSNENIPLIDLESPENTMDTSQESPVEQVSRDTTPEQLIPQDTPQDCPVENVSEDTSQERPMENVSQDITEKPPVGPISQDITEEPPVEPISQATIPVERPPTPETVPNLPNPRRQVPMFYVNVNNKLSRGSFLEPGDLIVKFHTLPSRVIFMVDDHDAMY
ncbi:PiggyBac transposable element-derived protein like [Argiope bruennichi]|uniref:PiggyBac transposable element-derived protein like n=1 Tax=Argiope bruennichi TaxID=94029 RepID=A0A8T0FG77_ARGBR|nr:PiggyBac transposable element-derived protein like [Argiope bruennichi]